jgi:citrate synthase
MSRITGWTAHIIEQAGSNALIRPLSQYSGLPQRDLSNGSRIAARAGR